ncbi:hypothetical protein PTKIN_Ptkin02bG0034600 [Pterospermum kingtungense]
MKPPVMFRSSLQSYRESQITSRGMRKENSGLDHIVGRGKIQKDEQTKLDGDRAIPWFNMDPIGVKYDQNGKILEQLDGNGGFIFYSVSEIEEYKGKLYIGSVVKPYVGVRQA